jgi:hypothetical protein
METAIFSIKCLFEALNEVEGHSLNLEWGYRESEMLLDAK